MSAACRKVSVLATRSHVVVQQRKKSKVLIRESLLKAETVGIKQATLSRVIQDSGQTCKGKWPVSVRYCNVGRNSGNERYSVSLETS